MVRLTGSSTQPMVAVGQEAIIAGYGGLTAGGPKSNTLNWGKIKYKAFLPREHRLEGYFLDRILEFLPADPEWPFGRKGSSACHGDSGGPVFFKQAEGTWGLLAITSSGGCDDPSIVGVRAVDVRTYADWILGE